MTTAGRLLKTGAIIVHMVGRVSSPRFVSRLDELGVLAAALARAQAGDGSLVLVWGDSGVARAG